MPTTLSPLKQKNKLLRFALDMLFPSFCVGCHKEGAVLCSSCREGIIIRRVPSRVKPQGVSAVYAACEYREPIVAALVQELKYGGVTDIADVCAELIGTHLSCAGFSAPEHAVVVPVPLSKKRMRERGFNQSELIGKQIARAFSLPFLPKAMVRIRDTKPQTETGSRSERALNIKNAFACYSKEAVKGKHIILIDDVFTTGATLSECAKTLKSAGATRVTALTVAE